CSIRRRRTSRRVDGHVGHQARHSRPGCLDEVTTPHYLGLMSGTSADAIDAALVAFDPAPRLVQALAAAYPDELRAQILALSQAPQTPLTLDEVAILDHRIGDAFADVACAALENARAKGYHVA